MLRNHHSTTHSIIDENEAQSIKEILSDDFSVDLTHFENFVFRRRISVAFSFLKIIPQNIISKTQKLDNEKVDVLKHFLYTGENELFRDTETWIFIRDKILKELTNSKINILFYNSTTGEELYSLLILLNEFFPNNNFKITILSPSEYSLNNIKEGKLAQPKNRSSQLNFKEVLSNKEISKYLDYKNNVLTFNKTFINNITYKHRTFEKSIDISDFDLIMCRNKILPFTSESAYLIFNEIASILKPKGYLVLGINENLPQEFSGIFNVVSKNERIFIKKPNGK